MRKNKIILFAFMLLAKNAYADAVICEKMKGNMLDIKNNYISVDFGVEQEIINWDKNSEKISFITGGEQQEFLKVIDDDNYLRGVNISNGSYILTYDKKKRTVFYSKHGLFLAQYFAKCKNLK